MAHDYHEGQPGFDERQILHDGCLECEERGKSVERALAYMDTETFVRAWRRAFDFFGSRERVAVGVVSHAEYGVLSVIWGIQVQLERAGVPLNGHLPL